jgi:hypothetical protein
MATPFVAGMAALVKTAYPGYTSSQIINYLYDTAVDLGSPGWDEYYGNGMVNGSDTGEYPMIHHEPNLDISLTSISDSLASITVTKSVYEAVYSMGPDVYDIMIGEIDIYDYSWIAEPEIAGTVTVTNGTGISQVDVGTSGDLLFYVQGDDELKDSEYIVKYFYYNNDNPFDQAIELSIDSTIDGSLDTSDETDYYKFEITTDSAVQIYTSGSLDTIGRLYDSNIDLISYNDDGGTGFNFKIVENLSAGEYYVSLYEYFGDTGDYTIHLKTFDDTYTDDKNNATPLPLDTVTDGSLDFAGDEDWFSTDITEEGVYRIDIASESIDLAYAYIFLGTGIQFIDDSLANKLSYGYLTEKDNKYVLSFVTDSLTQGTYYTVMPDDTSVFDALDYTIEIYEDPALSFNDSNFEGALMTILNKAPGEDILYSDVDRIQRLTIRDYGVSTVENLEYFYSLNELILPENNISTNNDFGEIGVFDQLNLSMNGLNDISFLSGLGYILTLDISGNSITNINALDSLPMFSLDASNNNIQDLPEIYTGMEYINIQNNDISSISNLDGLISISGLLLGGNNITDYTACSAFYDNLVLKDFTMPPVASGVSVSGEAEENKTITGSYTYSDMDNDTEQGTVLAWYRSSSSNGTYSKISDADESTYKLTGSDIGKYIKFAVKPKSNNGNEISGIEYFSGAFGPVSAKPAPPPPPAPAPAPIVTVLAPTATPDEGEFSDDVHVELSTETEGAEIRYTLNNTAPDENSSLYTGKIVLTESTTIKAIAIKGGDESEISTFVYTIVRENETITEGEGNGNVNSVKKETQNDDGTISLDVDVDETSIESVITSGDSDEIPVIDATSTSDIDDISIDVAADIFIKADNEGKELVVETNNVDFNIEPGTLPLDGDEQDVELRVKNLTTDDLDEEMKQKAENTNEVSLVFDFDLMFDGESVTEDFNKPMTITIKYDASLVSDGDKVGVYYYNEQDGKWEYVGGIANGDGTITFTIDHFSIYQAQEFIKTFADIQNHWAQVDIEKLASRYIIKGNTEDKFLPNDSITRAEFAALVVRALGLTEEDNDVLFTDIQNKWYESSVKAAYKAGIITGRSATKFAPDDIITRQEMAVMIIRAYAFINDINLDTIHTTQDIVFNDDSEISSWARLHVRLAASMGIINGRPGNIFDPLGTATRAEGGVVIRRLLSELGIMSK